VTQSSFVTPSPQRNSHTLAGFSLMELIGVMAVTAILASVILPSVIRQVQIQAGKNETAFLQSIGSALTDHLLRNKAFPDESTWAQAVASELGVPAAKVLESPQQSQRIYIIDPALRLGTASGTLPFTQNGNGSIDPVSPRIMVLSSLDGTKVIPLSEGVAAAADFDELWTLPTGSVPSGWDTLWQQSGEDLKVVRINLASLFHKVILNNYDSANPGGYSVDGGASQSVPAGSIATFFVETTVLGLHDNAGSLETRQILRKPVAFTYERGTWRGQVHQGLQLSGDDVYNATSLFALSASNGDAQAGAAPSLVIDRFTDFMNRYAEWDAANFPGNGSQSYNAVIAAQTALGNTTSPLVYSPAPPGGGGGGGGPNPTVTVSIQLDSIGADRINWKLTNTGAVDAVIDSLTLSWPGSEDLKEIKFDGVRILNNDLRSSPATILADAWVTESVNRTLYAGNSDKVLEIKFIDDFPLQASQPASDFNLIVNFSSVVTYTQAGSVSF
jgi:type II secretory pathway pseudopilin PulG